MKKFYKYAFAVALTMLLTDSLQAQWRWGRDSDFEKIDTVVSIPKKGGNSIYISDNDFYLRLGFLGLNLEVEDDWDYDWRNRRRRSRNIEYYEQHDHGTLKGINLELGFNNFLNDGEFPSSSDLFQVNPLRSIYVGLNWNHTTYISGPLYLDWGGGLSWYNFKFENAATRLDPSGGELNFFEDNTISSAIKSKLKVTYLNFTAVPMFDFGKGRRQVRMYEEDDVRVAFSRRRGFRIGIGGYVGYRIGQKAKYISRRNGDRNKDKEKSSFFLNDLRYGARLQIGVNSFDMFINYDLNELFEDGRGPKLNPVSIGIIL